MGYYSNLSVARSDGQIKDHADPFRPLDSRPATVANINADFATVEAREWHEWVVEAPQFEEAPEPPLGVSPAFRLGWDEATSGAPFCPEAWYGDGSLNFLSYVDGFLSVRPDCTPALAIYAELVPVRGVDVDYAERSL